MGKLIGTAASGESGGWNGTGGQGPYDTRASGASPPARRGEKLLGGALLGNCVERGTAGGVLQDNVAGQARGTSLHGWGDQRNSGFSIVD